MYHVRGIETLKTEDFTMRYFRFGDGGEPFVILPGLSVQSVTGAAGAVAESYRAFAADYTVYVFDRREDPPDPYPVREMARDTAAAFRALGLSRVNLFGASQGGMIAMAIAAEAPELVRSLILGSTAAYADAARSREIEAWIRLAKAGERAALYRAFGEAVYPPAVYEKFRAVLEGAAETVTAEELRRFVILAEGTRGFDVTADLAGITCPALVLGSRDDRVLGAEAAGEIAARLPHARLYLYENYGHAAYDTAPDYKERILRFLADKELFHAN